MPRPLSLGFSPCPNDAFVFHALVHGRVAPGLTAPPRLSDVEALNGAARRGELDVAKVSYHALAWLADRYRVLPAGGALGSGVGPLVVARRPFEDLRGLRLATPGGLTTAALLLRLAGPAELDTVELRYDRIMPAVAAGEVDAGLIIHESRFTYPEHGLVEVLDLGAWWEQDTGLPLPLGGVAARRELGDATLARVADAVQRSVAWAWAHPEDSAAYVAEHAQEMDPDVRRRHIELYVNDFTRDLGEAGRAAVRELLGRAARRGLVPPLPDDAFLLPAPA